MDRLRILAAAAVLGEFTPRELAAFVGSNENTVRSVVRRDKNLFTPVHDEAPPEPGSGPGRPPTRLRVADPGEIRSLVRQQEQALASLEALVPLPTPNDDGADEEGALAALMVAEDALLRAWDADDPQRRDLLANTARNSLATANSQFEAVQGEERALALGRSTPFEQRVEAIETLIDVVEQSEPGGAVETGHLAKAASAVAQLLPVAGIERSLPFFERVTTTAVRGQQLPPVVLMLEHGARPGMAISDVAGGSWVVERLPGVVEPLWSQTWSAPLVEKGLIAGVLVQAKGEANELQAALNEISALHVPTVVVSDTLDVDLVTIAAAAGAVIVPATATGLIRIVGNAFSNITGRLHPLFDSAQRSLADESQLTPERAELSMSSSAFLRK